MQCSNSLVQRSLQKLQSQQKCCLPNANCAPANQKLAFLFIEELLLILCKTPYVLSSVLSLLVTSDLSTSNSFKFILSFKLNLIQLLVNLFICYIKCLSEEISSQGSIKKTKIIRQSWDNALKGNKTKNVCYG